MDGEVRIGGGKADRYLGQRQRKIDVCEMCFPVSICKNASDVHGCAFLILWCSFVTSIFPGDLRFGKPRGSG
jgi:hypothetical protein